MGGVDQWANIHLDMLNEIANQFYSYDDYVRLQLVCKQWTLKLPKIPPNHNRNPWLVLPNVVETVETHNLEEKEIYYITLPEMQNNFIRGSCYGWLISVIISEGTIQMFNPTKAHFDLPPISTLPDVIGFHPDRHGEEYDLLDLRDDEIFRFERIQMHKHEIWKVVVSSPPDNDNDDFMAVAIYGECGRLAFCKLHDRRWRDIPTTEIEMYFQDVIFFQGKIYAIDLDPRLYEFDTKSKPLPTGGIIEVAPPGDILDRYTNASMNKYLIGCADGGLLMLVRHLTFIPNRNGLEEGQLENYKFDIFKLNKNAKEWSRVYSLENYLLMIGYNSSVQMLPHTFSNGRGNHIYYTDNQVELHSSDFATSQNIGILNLEDGISKKPLSNVKFLCPPTWLLS